MRAHYPEERAFRASLSTVGVHFDAILEPTAALAGELWQANRGAATRTRAVADFLIGAHAMLQADALLSRDRGFYRGLFDGRNITDPSEA